MEYPGANLPWRESKGLEVRRGSFVLAKSPEGRCLRNSELVRGPRRPSDAEPDNSFESGEPRCWIMADPHLCLAIC